MKRNFIVMLATLAASLTISQFAWAQGVYGSAPLAPVSNSSGIAPVISPGAMTAAGYFGPSPVMPASYVANNNGCGCGAGCAAGSGCSAGGGCSTGGCDNGCGGCANWCCDGGYTNCWSFFGEFLYLRSRDTEVAWAVPINGAIAPPGVAPVQIGRVATSDFDNQPGFRAGFSYNPDCCTSISATYTMWESNTNDTIGIGAPFVLNSLVSHPGAANAALNFLTGQSRYGMSVDMVDVDLHSLLTYCPEYQFGYVAGVRWAQSEQDFRADFAGNGTETVITNVYFSGIGAKGGFEGEKWLGRQLSVYGKGLVSLMAGQYSTTYQEGQNANPAIVNTSWKAGRIVPIMDLEMGASWTSRCDTWKLSAGYLYSVWFNSVQTDEWINSVRTNNYVGLSDTMTFDGLTARLEARY